MDAISEFVNKIPPVTRYVVGFTFFLTFCMNYMIINPSNLLLDWHYVFK